MGNVRFSANVLNQMSYRMKELGEKYGKDAVVYNLHGLVHLPMFGCLDCISL